MESARQLLAESSSSRVTVDSVRARMRELVAAREAEMRREAEAAAAAAAAAAARNGGQDAQQQVGVHGRALLNAERVRRRCVSALAADVAVTDMKPAFLHHELHT